MCFLIILMAPFSYLSSHHSPHHSDPTHPSSHHSPLLLLITPLTPIHTTPPLPHYFSLLPLTTSSHHSPHYSPSPPLLTYPPHHTPSPPSSPLPSSPTFLTYLPHHTSSPPSSPPTPLLPTTLKRDIITP